MAAKFNAIFHNGVEMISVGPFDSVELADEFGLLNNVGEDVRYLGTARVATRKLLSGAVDAIKKHRIGLRVLAQRG